MSDKTKNTDKLPLDKDGDKDKKNDKKFKMSDIPSKQMWGWVFILILIPLFFLMFLAGSDKKTVEISASEFENQLNQNNVIEIVFEEQNSSTLPVITGTMKKTTPIISANGEDANTIRFKTKVVYTDRLDKLIEEKCPNRKIETSNSFITNMLYTLLPTILLVVLLFFMYSRMMKSAGNGAMQFGKSRAKISDGSKEKVMFKDVAGAVEAKEDMEEIVEYLKDPGKFKRLGGKIPRGVLMVGPPGTGKTLLAKAIAGEADVPFFSISGSDFVEMFVGVGASRVRDMFKEGHKHAPCLIFIDEIDAVGRSRFTGIGGGHDEREQTLNALLVEMDGFEANSGVIILAATNRPDVLDPALLRPGRFDRQISIDLPDMRGRYGILNIHAKKVKMNKNVDLHQIARATPGFSGADLASLVNEAALLATRRNKESVEMDELEESRDKVRWGKERRSRHMDERDRKLTAYHESGHALVGMLCENAPPLHKITIIPRGVAYLGATMSLPEQDKIHMTRNELLDHVAVCFGGRVAEEIIFGDVTTGASQDIVDATNTVKKMVCCWGMSERLSLINYGNREEPVFVGRDMSKGADYSPETAREIDLEIRKIIREAEDRVRQLLKDNKDKLVKLSETLLERETMNAPEVYELLEMEMPESKRSPEDIKRDFVDDDKLMAKDNSELEAEQKKNGADRNESANVPKEKQDGNGKKDEKIEAEESEKALSRLKDVLGKIPKEVLKDLKLEADAEKKKPEISVDLDKEKTVLAASEKKAEGSLDDKQEADAEKTEDASEDNKKNS